MMRRLSPLAVVAALSLAGCAVGGQTPHTLARTAQPAVATPVTDWLRTLPPPAQPVDVAVFRFPDLTGQYKPSDSLTTYSRAVSQGGLNVLLRTLLETGNGSWFRVMDRSQIDDVLRERSVIREVRASYTGPDGEPLSAPGPIRYAGVLFSGGVVAYDSNVRSAGAGLRIWGVGGSTQIRHDLITVSLSAVSSVSGEVLHSVMVQKGVYAVVNEAGAFRFLDDRTLLELEAGIATNEPGLLALRQAIEMAVYQLIIEGADKNLWGFADAPSGTLAREQFEARVVTRSIDG
ncbi:hypothetical protein JN531_003545 [Flagellatimonas centrodinii]|uniref:CsgG/HfaB family protein n=1 Tax=Flagellatimonas centrodinii TaxID=2806210 RepID=UPI001FEDC514|nr:CsgG/HfaB family protein [Flagellatimonas centrodinii]ULQ47363.1 hypothetical protein JN531_003545 [Flagellatimonas centrodinii]